MPDWELTAGTRFSSLGLLLGSATIIAIVMSAIG